MYILLYIIAFYIQEIKKMRKIIAYEKALNQAIYDHNRTAHPLNLIIGNRPFKA
jgi:hypothetical protein